MLDNGFIDTYRHLYPNKMKFTSNFYDYELGMLGWRLDYFLMSNRLSASQGIKLIDSVIHDQFYFGSDHCPIELNLQLMNSEERAQA